MQINKRVRDQVINDLKRELIDETGQSLVVAFFSGRGEPVTASDDDVGVLEIPAISVYFESGEANGGNFSCEEWQATLCIEIMDLAVNGLDDELDKISEKVLTIINQSYTANGLLILCNRSSFEYLRDDGAPWGSLILKFNTEMETE